MYHKSPVNDVLPFAFACDGCYIVMRGFGLLSMARCESFMGPICPTKWADGLKPLLESLYQF